MSTSNFPTSQDNSSTLPNPPTGSHTSSPSHGALHTTENDAIKALEAKVGTGSGTTPAANKVLLGTGAGASDWTGLTSAQLASVVSDETGTGVVAFSNTPTLVTPKVDTINESTLNNGVTIDGLNIQNGALNTNNSVVNSNLATGISSSKLSNTYKFSVYRNASWSTPNNTQGLVTFDTKTFDTSANYSTSSGKFTAPVAGFYPFSANVDFVTAVSAPYATLYVNGSEVRRGFPTNASAFGASVSSLLQLSANDFVQVFVFTPSSVTGTTGSIFTYFSGFLLSAT